MSEAKNIQKFWNYCIQEAPSLEDFYPGINSNTLYRAFEDFLKKTHWETSFFKHAFVVLQGAYHKELKKFLELLKKGVPFAHMMGSQYFYESEFYVTPEVLIPRFESEILVEESLNILNKISKKNIKVIEVGVGSGALILSLAQKWNAPAKFLGTDISPKALKIAQKNHYHHQYRFHSEIEFFWAVNDRLKYSDEIFQINFANDVDFILSNPPYIKKNLDRKKVHPLVDKYDPHLALYLDDEIYDSWFEEFFSQMYQTLKEGGLFLIEGHEDHLEKLSDLSYKIGFRNQLIINDLSQRPRFLKAEKLWSKNG